MKRVGTTLFLVSEGSHIEIRGECLVVRVKGVRVRDVPLRTVENVTIMCWDGWLSAETIRRCSEHKIAINVMTPHGKFQSRVEGCPTGNILLRREHYRVADDAAKSLELAKAMIRGKAINQSSYLKRKNREGGGGKEDCWKLDAVSDRILRAQSHEHLLGLEGEAAAIYFSNWDTLVRNSKFQWNGRNRKPPKDELNALLSFLYVILANDCKSACLTAGLDPYCGLFHKDKPGRPSLALDLMEEFRVKMADQCAVFIVNNNVLTPSEFTTKKIPGSDTPIECLLGEESLKRVIEVYQKRKLEEVTHPAIGEKIPWGWCPTVQARLLAKAIREGVAYSPMLIP